MRVNPLEVKTQRYWELSRAWKTGGSRLYTTVGDVIQGLRLLLPECELHHRLMQAAANLNEEVILQEEKPDTHGQVVSLVRRESPDYIVTDRDGLSLYEVKTAGLFITSVGQ